MSTSSKSNQTRAMDNPVVSVPPPGKMLEAAGDTFLLDDIVIDILSRLPSKDVFRCQCVCKKWRDLMSTQDFVNLHIQSGLRSTVPIILVEEQGKHGKTHIFYDEWWMPAQKKPMTQRFDSYPSCSSSFSQDGFLVLRSEDRKEIIISNPMRSEKVRIIVPEVPGYIHVQGMFFSQTLKEYCLLLGVFLKDNSSYDYIILNLGPKPCTRQILNPWNHLCPFGDGYPLVIEHLYWLVFSDSGPPGDLMEFDTKTELFTLLHCPVVKTVVPDDFGLDLVNIDGFLSVVRIARVDMVVDVTIWTLKDRAKESWATSNYCFCREVYPEIGVLKTLAYKDGELVIQSDQKLVVWNLKMATVRNFGKEKYHLFGEYNACGSTFSHTISLASLRSCKSKICMEGEDEELALCGLS